ncbi:hypothetical protein Baya_12506 [Bagarius yarrelli]|uniref:Uncharacterized protein n=1 Tax=Bagarius yarrelli TaxID=175774 RepID=A0A556V8J7_BAGYA|nr:hypothetical protein Baya_12506 [Bagarius yarrelli]
MAMFLEERLRNQTEMSQGFHCSKKADEHQKKKTGGEKEGGDEGSGTEECNFRGLKDHQMEKEGERGKPNTLCEREKGETDPGSKGELILGEEQEVEFPPEHSPAQERELETVPNQGEPFIKRGGDNRI